MAIARLEHLDHRGSSRPVIELDPVSEPVERFRGQPPADLNVIDLRNMKGRMKKTVHELSIRAQQE